MTITSVTKNTKKVWLNSATNDKYVKFWQKIHQKIINHNILHTPSNVGVMVRKTFSHTLDEAMSVGLAKACDLRENLFCWRENQSFHWKSNRMRNLHAYIKESINIRVNNPTLNNNIGKFDLPHIWDRVLLNTQGLNLKRQVNNNNTQHN